MNSPRITAVVVTYKSARVVGAALTSLRRSHERGLLECIVVDNLSTDETVEIVRREHPWAHLIPTGKNLGYGRGCNVGLAETTTPYVMFMNPDATIEPDHVERLRAFLEARPAVGMVAPALTGGSELQIAGGLASPRTIMIQATGRRLKSRRPIVPGQPAFQADWLCGALFMMRTDVVRRFGGFDPRFFLYFEETDLCRRVLKEGLELWAVGEAVAHHEGGASAVQEREGMFAGCISEHYFRSRYYYLRKHWGLAVATVTELTEVALVAMRWVARRVAGRGASYLTSHLRRPILRLPAAPEAWSGVRECH